MKMNGQIQIDEGSFVETEDLVKSIDSDHINPIGAPRGVRACMKDGWRIFALNARLYSARLALPSVVAGVGLMFPLWLLVNFYARNVAPVLIHMKVGASLKAVCQLFLTQHIDYISLVGSIIFAIVCCCLFRGALWSQLSFFFHSSRLTDKTFIPWAIWEKMSVRYFLFIVPIALLSFIVGVGIITLALLTGIYYLLLFIPLFLLLIRAFVIAGLSSYMLGASYAHGWKIMWRIGRRHVGGYIVLTVLTDIPLLAMAMVLLLPYLTILFAYEANAINIVTEISSGFPVFMPVLDFMIGALSLSVLIFVSTLQVWTITLKTAADVVQANEANIE